jgi:hypothetical protein
MTENNNSVNATAARGALQYPIERSRHPHWKHSAPPLPACCESAVSTVLHCPPGPPFHHWMRRNRRPDAGIRLYPGYYPRNDRQAPFQLSVSVRFLIFSLALFVGRRTVASEAMRTHHHQSTDSKVSPSLPPQGREYYPLSHTRTRHVPVGWPKERQRSSQLKMLALKVKISRERKYW